MFGGIVANVDATYTESGGGRTGKAGDYALTFVDGGTAHVPNADFLNLAGSLDLMTVSLWQKNTGTRNASSYWMLADGFDRANQAHIPCQRLQFDPSVRRDWRTGIGQTRSGTTKVTCAVNGVTLTWRSRDGKNHSVEYIEVLAANNWIELDDGVASEGEETSWTDDDPARMALPDGWKRGGTQKKAKK